MGDKYVTEIENIDILLDSRCFWNCGLNFLEHE